MNCLRYKLINNIERFYGKKVFWYAEEALFLMPKINVFMPDNSVNEIIVKPLLNTEFTYNGISYVIEEVAEDKKSVWVEEVK